MQELIRIVFLGVAGVMLAIQLKGQKPEYGIYIGIATGILLFGYAVRQTAAVMEQFGRLKAYLGGAESYLGVLLKVIGITYVCEFGADICKDAGHQTVAGQIEVLGKLSVMFAGLPVLFAVIDQIQSFL